MINQIEERNTITVKKTGETFKGYKSHEKNNFAVEEDVVGLDANVLVDMVESKEFKKDIKSQVSLGVLKICTTSVALGEAKHVLIKKRSYDTNKAMQDLKGIIGEFRIEIVKHLPQFNAIAEQWVAVVKNKMRIKKFKTFPNDCRILSNLHYQAGVNLYITEDTDLEKAVRKLNLPIRIKIIGEASNLNGQTVKEFFKKNRKAFRKKHGP